MATAFSSMSFNTHFQGNQCIDHSELDNFVDFGSMPSPSPSNANGKAPLNLSGPASAVTSPTNTITPLDFEEQQTPIKPSHEYERFKQQTGLPTGSFGSLTGLPNDYDNFSSMGGDLGVGSSSMYSGMGSNSGLGIDTDMNFDDMAGPSTNLPAFFFPGQQNQDFIDPTAITSPDGQAQQHVRFYPGMHQQQAAMAKAQQQAQQQRQQQMIQQAQKQRANEQPARSNHGQRKSNTPIDARTEETIARVVNQIRQNNSSSFGPQDADSPSPLGHGMSKLKKDEEDMDEDERLLASEEGKKLTSKERRQLRNKVSARAFRSRRKEYISQLEGEVAGKANEANDLRVQNRALMEENARFRELTIKLLRHPAFTPFLEDISRDPALSDSLNKVTSSMNATAAATEASSAAKDSKPFVAPQEPQQQTENLHIGMATIPETQLDFSALNLNGSNSWAMPGMSGFGFQQSQVFAVTEVPEAPVEIEQELDAVKGEECIIERFTPADDAKEALPAVEEPVEAESEVEESVVDKTVELDSDYALYTEAPAVLDVHAIPGASNADATETIFSDFASEKIFGYELVDAENVILSERTFASVTARCERLFSRLEEMSTQFK